LFARRAIDRYPFRANGIYGHGHHAPRKPVGHMAAPTGGVFTEGPMEVMGFRGAVFTADFEFHRN
jgi:hypothetical protein